MIDNHRFGQWLGAERKDNQLSDPVMTQYTDASYLTELTTGDKLTCISYPYI